MSVGQVYATSYYVLMILMLAPTVTVVGYEVLEYRHQVARLAE
jgi:hypothetical protein